MLILSQKELQMVLRCFGGSLISDNQLTEYQKFSLTFFSDPQKISNPKIEFTTQLDITEIHKNYELHYKTALGATFTAYFKWILIKAMVSTPFNWRYINHQWYQFNNLPLTVAMRTSDERSLIFFLLRDIVNDSWECFCQKHSLLHKNNLDITKNHDDLEVASYGIAYQIERLHIPRMTYYRTTTKITETHRPSIIFSDPYPLEGKLYLPVNFSISHASLMPKLAEQFLDKVIDLAKKMPNEVQAEHQCLLFSQSNYSTFSKRAKL